ncbi:MAG: OmpA family protein [Hyphomicrobium sp.]
MTWPLIASALTSVAALAVTSPAIAEPAQRFQVAQGAPVKQLTEEEKKKLEEQRRQKLIPPALKPNSVVQPPAAVKTVKPPVVQPKVVPLQPKPLPVAKPVKPPPPPAVKTVAPPPPPLKAKPPVVAAPPPAKILPPPAVKTVAPPPPRAKPNTGKAFSIEPPQRTLPPAYAPPPKPVIAAPVKTPVPVVQNLEQAKSGRTQKIEQGGKRVVIKEADKRTIVRQGNKVVIQKDEAAQLRRVAPGAVITRGKLGSNTAVVERPNNVKIITETDRNGQLVRRFRRDGDGRETAILDNRRKKSNFGRNLAIGVGVGAGLIAGAAILNSVVDVPPPVVRVPRDKYIVRYEDASEDDVYEALNAPPVEESESRYTLDQVRATPRLRERMRRVDLDDINFETGSWEVDPAEYRKLERIARAMNRVIERNPNEVFLIEGHTDAVGSDVDNLTLSDRRAESVSVVLSEQFEVPFENLTTQGYGEEYLKVETDGPERANRRVAARRITPLLQQEQSQSAAPPPPARYEDRGYDDRPDYRERRRQWRKYRERRYDRYGDN